MRRAFLLAVLVLGFAARAGTAHALGSVGIGGYGGVAIPIVQDDVGSGSTFGIRVPINVIPLLSVEPFFASYSMGDAEEDFGGTVYTRDGFSGTEFGIHAMLGSLANKPGFRIYPFVGIASTKLTRDGSEDITEMGFQLGAGAGLVLMPKLAVDLRAEMDMVKTDDTSRKFGNITLGVSYDLYP